MRYLLLIASFFIKLLDFCLIVLGWFIIPIGLCFQKDNHMPKLFWLWDNEDHGVNGESFYIKLHSSWPNWLRSYAWSAFRNPTFNFSKYLIGYTATGVQTVEGNPQTDRDQEEGWYWVRDGMAWEYQYIKAYKFLGSRCIKFRAGWKIQGKDNGEICQFCFVPNPFSSYTGK